MIRIKKKLSDEELVWLVGELTTRIRGRELGDEFVSTFRAALTKLDQAVALEKVKPVKKAKKPVGVVKRLSRDKTVPTAEPMEGEVIFTTLRELMEIVKPQFDAGIQLRQYTNPISQLTGYATDDGNKYVISIVDLRKDPRADSFTFNPMKILEEDNE